jgi:hypothetical protein
MQENNSTSEKSIGCDGIVDLKSIPATPNEFVQKLNAQSVGGQTAETTATNKSATAKAQAILRKKV